jgi:hypothetical protein
MTERAGGFALVEAGGFAGFGPEAGALASRTGDPPQAATFGAFFECQVRRRLDGFLLRQTRLRVAW